MYLKFFNLQTTPFSYLTPNPDFFYSAPQYESVKGQADYIVGGRSGHIYISGPVGSGKTTLLKAITQSLEEDKSNIPFFLNAPNIKTQTSLVRRICDGFKVKTERSYSATLDNLTNWLIEKNQEKLYPILIIDEAQNIPRDGLKTLHYLMTYVSNTDLFLMIILCGQEELAARINKFKEIKSRMYPAALSSLTRQESEELIRFRWKVASENPENPFPFEKEAIDQVYMFSKGLPRDMCKVCDMALLSAFSMQAKTVDAKTIIWVASNLTLEGGSAHDEHEG